MKQLLTVLLALLLGGAIGVGVALALRGAEDHAATDHAETEPPSWERTTTATESTEGGDLADSAVATPVLTDDLSVRERDTASTAQLLCVAPEATTAGEILFCSLSEVSTDDVATALLSERASKLPPRPIGPTVFDNVALGPAVVGFLRSEDSKLFFIRRITIHQGVNLCRVGSLGAGDDGPAVVVVDLVYEDMGSPLHPRFSYRLLDGVGMWNTGIATVVRQEGDRYTITGGADLQSFVRKEVDGRITLTVTDPEYGKGTCELSPGQVARVRLKGSAALRVEILGYLGSGAEGLVSVGFEVQREAGITMRPYQKRVDWLGQVEFERLLPGRLDAVLRLGWGPHNGSEGIELERKSFELGPGANDVRWRLPELYPMRVRFAEGQQGRLWIRNGSFRMRADIRPELEIQLPKGVYTLTTEKESMQLEHPTGEVVDFTPQPPDCLRVHGLWQGGELMSLGVAEGDEIIAVSGKDLREYASPTAALADLELSDIVQLSIQRSDATREIEVRWKDVLLEVDVLEPRARSR